MRLPRPKLRPLSAHPPCAMQETPGFHYDERMTLAKAWRLVRIPTNVFVILQGLFGCLPWGMILTFLNDYLAQNKGLSVPTATTVGRGAGGGGCGS